MAWSGYIADLVVVAGFELGGCLVAEAAVQPGAVVPADVLGDGAAGAGSGGPGVVVEQLALDGTEEALGESVVPALAGAAVGQLDLAVRREGRELARCVLAAPVGVEGHSGLGVAGGDGISERACDQFGAQVIGDRVAD